MAIGAYIGKNNGSQGVANTVKGIYLGVNNKAQRVVKAYIGDANGKAQLWWGGSSGKKIIILQDGERPWEDPQRIFPNSPAGTGGMTYIETDYNGLYYITNIAYGEWRTTSGSPEISVDHLSNYYLTNKILNIVDPSSKVGDPSILTLNQLSQPEYWGDIILTQKYGASGDYNKTAYFIPVNRIYNPKKLIITRKNVNTGLIKIGVAGVGIRSTGLMSYDYTDVSNNNSNVIEYDISSWVTYMDYVIIWGVHPFLSTIAVIAEEEEEFSITNGFWFFYSTTTGNIIEYRGISMLPFPPPLSNTIVTKSNNGIAFYCISLDNNGACILAFSTDSNAVAYTDTEQGYVTNPTIGNVTINDEVWYYAYIDMRPNATADHITPNCAIEESSFTGKTPQQIVTQIINSRIYTDDFAEDYQVGQTYNLPAADIEKTVRKAIAIFLYKNAPLISNRNSYKLVLSNVETIVDHVLSDKGSYDKIHIVLTIPNDTDIWCTVYYSNDAVNNVTLSGSSYGFETAYDVFEFYNPTIHYYKYTQIRFLSNGSVTHQSASYTGVMTRTVGVAVSDSMYHGGHQVWLTNLGLKFTCTRGWVLPDFTPSQSYTLNATWDVENFIYNTIQKYIEKNVSYTQSPEIFTQLKENMSAIVSYLASFKGNRSGVAIKFSSGIAYQKLWTLYIVVQYLDTPKTLAIIDKQTKNGATYYTTNPFVVGAYTGEPAYEVSISMNSQISYQTITTGTNVNNIGYRWDYYSDYGFYELHTTNLGMVEE